MSAALVIDGHPDPASLTASMARAYAEGHGDARVLALRDLEFDPILRYGYRARTPLEPDLVDAKVALHAATRIVVATPMWWASTPALLKGFFDRVLLPGHEYRYPQGGLPEGLLRGRRGRVLLLADTPWYGAIVPGTPAAAVLKRNILGFCGIRPVAVNRFLGVKGTDDERRRRWLERARSLGARDARVDAGTATPVPSWRPVAHVA